MYYIIDMDQGEHSRSLPTIRTTVRIPLCTQNLADEILQPLTSHTQLSPFCSAQQLFEPLLFSLLKL